MSAPIDELAERLEALQRREIGKELAQLHAEVKRLHDEGRTPTGQAAYAIVGERIRRRLEVLGQPDPFTTPKGTDDR